MGGKLASLPSGPSFTLALCSPLVSHLQSPALSRSLAAHRTSMPPHGPQEKALDLEYPPASSPAVSPPCALATWLLRGDLLCHTYSHTFLPPLSGPPSWFSFCLFEAHLSLETTGIAPWSRGLSWTAPLHPAAAISPLRPLCSGPAPPVT